MRKADLDTPSRKPEGSPSPGRGGRIAYLLAPMLPVGLLVVVGLGCSRTDRSETDDPGREATHEVSERSDDSAMADSTIASIPDSLSGEAEKGSTGGFFARLFRRGNNDEEEQEDDPVPVELAAVEIVDLPSYLGTTATLEAEKQADLLAKVTGEIRQLLVEEGDRVPSGSVLAVLDGDVQEVAWQEADARLRAYDLDLERLRNLHEKELASDKDLNNAQSKYDEALAQRAAMRLQLDYTNILAPFDGVIAERFVDPGQTVAIGTQLFSIVDREPLLARIYLPEREALRVEVGQAVVVTPDTDPDLQVNGSVLRIAPIVDSRTGTVKVTCDVPGSPRRLHPGSFVRVQVRTELHAEALCIPKRALVPEGAETYVYRAVADSVEKIQVRTGTVNGDLVEITEGLSAGEKVVSVGHGALRSGTKIEEIVSDQASLGDSSASEE